ncbi:MAG TPA: hypothetical protein PKA48_08030, partial [Candidatus Obscuribacter sp.]|nr:hypothetical protein [Candidatus Obscuribacter sp.]
HGDLMTRLDVLMKESFTIADLRIPLLTVGRVVITNSTNCTHQAIEAGVIRSMDQEVNVRTGENGVVAWPGPHNILDTAYADVAEVFHGIPLHLHQRHILNVGADQMNALNRFQITLESYKSWRLNQGAESDGSPYQDWSQLNDAFLELLNSSSPSDWRAAELDAIQSAVTASRTFIGLIPEELVFDVFTQRYSNVSFRMSLLIESRIIKNAETVQRVLLHFFHNDESEAIKDHAFEMLASRGWSGVEEFAEKLWKTGDISRKMTVLMALSHYDSSNLDRYLELASNDPDLSVIVRAIHALRDSHRW